MLVRKLKVFPVEAIVRGYITGSAWSSYQKTGEVNGKKMPEGLEESQELPEPIYTPSTKAELGQHDENISTEQAATIVGEKYAKRIEELSLKIYKAARDYAKQKGIIIADTKFEFGNGAQKWSKNVSKLPSSLIIKAGAISVSNQSSLKGSRAIVPAQCETRTGVQRSTLVAKGCSIMVISL